MVTRLPQNENYLRSASLRSSGSPFISTFARLRCDLLAPRALPRFSATMDLADVYPATPMMIDVELDGLTNGKLYEIEVDIWSDDLHSTTLRSDIVIEVESTIAIE